MLPGVLPSSVVARRGHFVLESGHHSDLWLDLEGLCLDPRAVRQDAERLASMLRPFEIDAVCGPLNEGALIGLMVASALGCAFAYTERFPQPDPGAMFPVQYRLPAVLRDALRGRRVGIVNDVTSAGSAVRGTFSDVERAGGTVVAIGSLLVLGTAIDEFAHDRNVPVVALQQAAHNQWLPSECPLCSLRIPIGSESPRC